MYKSIENTLPISVEKGELTYCAYHLGLQYIDKKGENYQNISDAIAALNDASAELRRRVLDPYENKKIKQNGDIFIKSKLLDKLRRYFK